MGANGRSRYLARFGHDRMLDRVTSLYAGFRPAADPREVGMSTSVVVSTEDLRPVELARRSLAGDLPLRYQRTLEYEFQQRLDAALQPGMQVLDVGSGRLPCRAPERRPRGCHYVGLDISETELATATAGSYDECVVADISGPCRPELVGRFDLVVSFQVLEHVRPLEQALDNMHAYLRPGGRLIAQMSGAFTPFSLLGKVMPHRPKVWLLHNLLDREPAEIFPAHYDRCYASALRRLTREWNEVEIVALHRGASYLHFSKVLRALYLVYERGLARRGFDDLAAYFIVDATKEPLGTA
jgi:2-polyprenyl-6-hydroxyphenyl methylase/3-demethylubiquinone-9 3-methyltransferase